MRARLILSLGLLMSLMPACRMNYSFTGGDVGEARTVSVDLIEARAPLATPLSAQVLTETLRDLLLAQTPLKLKSADGDVQYSGILVGYDVQPVSIQANETAALNRLTMTVNVTYLNKLDPKKNLEFTVARFADYDSSRDLVTVEEQLAREIGKQLAQDIFDRTLGELVITMERERLTRLVEDPGLVGRGDLADLQSLAERFPWFAGAQVLWAVGEHKADEVLSEEVLRTSAAHIPSRAVLYDLVSALGTPPAHPLTVVPNVDAPITAIDPVPPIPVSSTPPPAIPIPEVPGPEVPSPLEVEPVAMAVHDVGAADASPVLEADPLERQIREAALASAYDLSLLAETFPVEEGPSEAPLAETITAAHPPPIAATSVILGLQPLAEGKTTIRKGDRLRFTSWLEAASGSPQHEQPRPIPVAEIPSGAEDWLRSGPDSAPEATIPAPTAPVLKEPADTRTLVDRFIKQQTPAAPAKAAFYTPQQAAKRSLDDTTGLVTETLARVYIKQGNLPKAIEAYRRLALKYPEKSAYFAALSKELEAQLNK